MIRVFLGDRLEIRAEVSCSPSDTIGNFKEIVALQLGMRAEAIMLKRQELRLNEDCEVVDGSSSDPRVCTQDR